MASRLKNNLQNDHADFLQIEMLPFEENGCVEWNSSTKALANFLRALGVCDPAQQARKLIEEFRSLSDLLSASTWQLRRVLGSRLAKTIRASHQLLTALLEEEVNEGPSIQYGTSLIRLLQAKVGFLQHERILALYVDGQGRLLRIQRLADGSLNEASLDRRVLFGCAFTTGAAGFVLVHNHPSGDPQPSQADIALTQRLRREASSFNLTMLDHLIVARGRIGRVEDWYFEARNPSVAPGEYSSLLIPLSDGAE